MEGRVHAQQGFRSLAGTCRTISGYEVIPMIRKGQARWLPKGDVIGQVLFIEPYSDFEVGLALFLGANIFSSRRRARKQEKGDWK